VAERLRRKVWRGRNVWRRNNVHRVQAVRRVVPQTALAPETVSKAGSGTSMLSAQVHPHVGHMLHAHVNLQVTHAIFVSPEGAVT
jgi:hypothetical protein